MKPWLKTVTKNGKDYHYWMGSWRQGGKVHNVHLGTARLMTAEQAQAKADVIHPPVSHKSISISASLYDDIELATERDSTVLCDDTGLLVCGSVQTVDELAEAMLRTALTEDDEPVLVDGYVRVNLDVSPELAERLQGLDVLGVLMAAANLVDVQREGAVRMYYDLSPGMVAGLEGLDLHKIVGDALQEAVGEVAAMREWEESKKEKKAEEPAAEKKKRPRKKKQTALRETGTDELNQEDWERLVAEEDARIEAAEKKSQSDG